MTDELRDELRTAAGTGGGSRPDVADLWRTGQRRRTGRRVMGALAVVASVAVGYVMSQAYASATPETWFPAFLGLFMVLFAASGIGNGSTFRTIGVIFDRQQAGPVLGWTSAVAAYGAFIAPVIIGQQITAGTPQMAMYGFAVFYALCLILN